MVSNSSRISPAFSTFHFIRGALSHSGYIPPRNCWILKGRASRQTASGLQPIQDGGARMKWLWLFYFPLLFIPNFGFTHQTDFGVLEVSDWLIVPFIVLLVIAPSVKHEQKVSKLNPLLWGFLAWALLSILSIHFRYEYLDDVPILVRSCLKLTKLTLYVIPGVLIAKKLS